MKTQKLMEFILFSSLQMIVKMQMSARKSILK